ncbi:hypothetical protein D9619_005580 [Psilocybe cf. subviscida]|uniref:Phosphatidic acid phosphatase type 2/haloperoxidase domain-containing protein n=1 Tax=Psilocybe cf. subviscida TaxID=2480587 RepID=A0A8H5BWT7_9AGAR|nr:hypothetical protein D9619_005580 [Psilocybe cf. subviscida]
MSYSRLHDPPSNIPMMKLPTSWTADRSRSAPVSPARRRKLIFSYAPDWVVTILLAAFFFSLDKVNGFRREFSLEDSSISYPYATFSLFENTSVDLLFLIALLFTNAYLWVVLLQIETSDSQCEQQNLALFFIAFVSPLLIMPVINFFTVRSWWDLHNSTLGLILGLAMTGSLTQVVKITVGRPRPDLLDRCQPPPGSVDPPFGLSNFTLCTKTDLLNDGFRSFFSGHSSLSFAGMGFLAFYLAGKLHMFDERGHASKAWLSLTPFLAASLVAISRTMDSRHHWQDVTVGSIVGIVFSFFAYRQYYPSLSSALSHRPYSPRIARDGDHAVLPTHTANSSISAPAGNATSSYQGGNQEFNMGTSYGNTAYTGGAHANSQDPYLEGTVPRPGPGSLEEVWKDGEEDGSRAEHANPGGRDTLYPGYHQAPPKAGPSAIQGA